jgi:hypothetical protein
LASAIVDALIPAVAIGSAVVVCCAARAPMSTVRRCMRR